MLITTINCCLIFTVSALLAWPLGKYMSKVYKGERNVLDFLSPFENFIYRICKIDPGSPMTWRQYVVAMLCINSIWLIWALVILLTQGKLFLNPAGNSSMDWSLAINAAISFLTSANLQHYSGETGATYLSQMVVFMFLQFVSAGTKPAVGIAVVRGLDPNVSESLGNFYYDFIRSLTRILLPLSLLTAIIFMLSGVPMTFHGPQKVITLQNDSVTVATGPVAAMVPIKELGSNGGGFFGANDAHPFENPGFFTFVIHSIIVFLLPMAFIFTIGYYLNHGKFGRMLFTIMTIGFHFHFGPHGLAGNIG